MENRLNTQYTKSRTLIFISTLIAAMFASWASYRIHILSIEEFALPILDSVMNLQGRAPDQYRVLPYLLIRGIYGISELVPANIYGLRIPILIFDTLSLTLAAITLRTTFPKATNQYFVWCLFLIYPYLQFDGYRPISAFILLISIVSIRAIMVARIQGGANTIWVLLAVLTLSFTRADVALLYSAVFVGATTAKWSIKAVVLATPLLAQLLLTQVLFPNAEYFSAVVMLAENLRGGMLLGSPLSYLVLAMLLLYRNEILLFCTKLFKELPIVAVALAGYVALLFIIAMPNEYRLFLPLLPIVLWRIEESRTLPI